MRQIILLSVLVLFLSLGVSAFVFHGEGELCVLDKSGSTSCVQDGETYNTTSTEAYLLYYKGATHEMTANYMVSKVFTPFLSGLVLFAFLALLGIGFLMFTRFPR